MMYLEVGSCVNDEGELVDLPSEYISFVLRKEIYHCSHAEYLQMDANDVLLDLEFLNNERRHRNSKKA